jgi:hypothetical protein
MGRKKKEIRLKEPVRIREKKIAGGNISLYLDIYQNGLRKKETLKLYLVPEVNTASKTPIQESWQSKSRRSAFLTSRERVLWIGTR